MDWKSVSESDLVGRFYIWKSETTPPGLVGYHKTICSLRPLFEKEQFKRHVSGYYVNRVCGESTRNEDTVRLTYFAPSGFAPLAVKEIKKFIEDKKLHEPCKSQLPQEDKVAGGYGGDKFELLFRQFLALETHVGLEIMEANLQDALSLVITFRLQNVWAHSSIPSHFKSAFQRSVTYCSLTDTDKKFLWLCLTIPEWSHFLVNLVIGDDLLGKPIGYVNKILEFYKMPFRISEIPGPK